MDLMRENGERRDRVEVVLGCLPTSLFVRKSCRVASDHFVIVRLYSYVFRRTHVFFLNLVLSHTELYS